MVVHLTKKKGTNIKRSYNSAHKNTCLTLQVEIGGVSLVNHVDVHSSGRCSHRRPRLASPSSSSMRNRDWPPPAGWRISRPTASAWLKRGPGGRTPAPRILGIHMRRQPPKSLLSRQRTPLSSQSKDAIIHLPLSCLETTKGPPKMEVEAEQDCGS